jgi:hypothetical protein
VAQLQEVVVQDYPPPAQTAASTPPMANIRSLSQKNSFCHKNKTKV